ncbi:hypothetical protein CIC12_05695 [Burkholderia sp. SG-MS1]|nr:hypothetical protein [Paraburkholderia sp. SG-MS1]
MTFSTSLDRLTDLGPSGHRADCGVEDAVRSVRTASIFYGSQVRRVGSGHARFECVSRVLARHQERAGEHLRNAIRHGRR